MNEQTLTLREILNPPPPQEWAIEREVSRLYRLTAAVVGSREAIDLFDRYGLNGDETYPEKIDLAEWIYTSILNREIRSSERSNLS